MANSMVWCYKHRPYGRYIYRLQLQKEVLVEVENLQIKQRVVQTTRTELTRTGLHTSVVENIEEESQGKRVIARALIPFIRPRTITVTGSCFRPGIRIICIF